MVLSSTGDDAGGESVPLPSLPSSVGSGDFACVAVSVSGVSGSEVVISGVLCSEFSLSGVVEEDLGPVKYSSSVSDTSESDSGSVVVWVVVP